MSAPSVSPSLSDQDWLAIWVGEHRLVLPLQEVHAVFSAQNNPKDDAIAPLDVEVHGGIPVFLIDVDPLPTSDASASTPAPTRDVTSTRRLPWVVALRPHNPDRGPCALTGWRVEGVRGPIRAPSQDGAVHWDGLAWPVAQPSAARYG